MAIIATGADLATEAADMLARADLTARIPGFVQRAEAKFNRAIRTREMEVLDQAFAITGEYVPAPLGFLDWKSGYLNNATRTPISYMPDDTQGDWFKGLPTGCAPGRYVSMVGTNFHFAPVPSGTTSATIIYRKALDSIATGGTTFNWLLLAHPDIYLYGTLLEAAPHLGDDARVGLWTSALERCMAALKQADSRSRFTNGLQVRVA